MALTKLDKNLLGFSDDTDFVKLPSGTTGQRPSSAAAGQFRFNTTLGDAEVYNGTAWTRMGTAPPTFSSVDYPGNDTALDPAGGQSLVINGGVFNNGITVTIGGTTPSSITRNSATQLTVTAPAKSAGTYALVFTNTDGGTATATNAVSYNGVPVFTNAAGSLGSVQTGSTVSLSAAAPEPDGGAVSHTISSGALPSGLSLNASTGAITGTAPSVSASTTSNFTVTANDNENQSVDRAYSITVIPKLPSDNFNIVTYAGNSASDSSGTTQSITGVGFKPDFVWIKRRDGAEAHFNFDSTRGPAKTLYPSSSDQQFNETNSLTSFDNDGFTVSGYNGTNKQGETFVAWCWRLNGGTTSSNTDGTITSTVQANNDLGFSIVKYTGDGATSKTVGHGLSSAPEMVFVKRLNSSADWYVWATPVMSITGSTSDYMVLNSSAAKVTAASVTNLWGGNVPSATTIGVGDSSGSNASGGEYIAYCFKNTDGFSNFGSYTAVSGDNIIETGFKPKFLMIKCTSHGSTHWEMLDSTRSPGLLSNGSAVRLRANDTSGDAGFNNTPVSFLTNGFKINKDVTANNYGDYDTTGRTFIYMAFAADPTTTSPTLADSFNTKTYTGNGSTQNITGVGFKPDMVWLKGRSFADNHNIADNVRGAKKFVFPNLNSREFTGSGYLTSFNSDGFTLGSDGSINASTKTYVGWNWKANNDELTISEGNAVAVYKFEDNVNDVAATYNGTASNISYASGKFNKAAVFNGSNSGVVLTNLNDTLEGTSFSISLWVKCSSTQSGDNGEATIIGSAASSGANGFDIMLKPTSGYLFFNFGNPNNDTVSTTDLRDNTWHHIVFTYTSSQALLYLDGNLLLTENSPNSLSSIPNEITLGKWSTGNYYALSGQIDQVRIYRGELKDIQVAKLYAETTSQNDDLNLGGPPTSIINVNQNAGFSIVKYTGTGIAGTKVSHGLSATPTFIITKRLNADQNWMVGSSNVGFTKYLELNDPKGEDTAATAWNNTAPTSTAITFGTSSLGNGSGDNYIMYCFHSVTGYSKFGTYEGHGSSQVNTVSFGFAPDFVIIKKSSGTGGWRMFDSVRDGTDGSVTTSRPLRINHKLQAEENTAEYDGTPDAQGYMDFTNDGIEFSTAETNSDLNEDGQTYIYMAFKIN